MAKMFILEPICSRRARWVKGSREILPFLASKLEPVREVWMWSRPRNGQQMQLGAVKNPKKGIKN